MKLVCDDISNSLVIDLHRVKLFEYLAKFIHENWPPAPISLSKLPVTDLYTYGM